MGYWVLSWLFFFKLLLLNGNRVTTCAIEFFNWKSKKEGAKYTSARFCSSLSFSHSALLPSPSLPSHPSAAFRCDHGDARFKCPSASSFLPFLETKIAYFVSLSCLFASILIQTHSVVMSVPLVRLSFSTSSTVNWWMSLPFSPLCALTISLFATPSGWRAIRNLRVDTTKNGTWQIHRHPPNPKTHCQVPTPHTNKQQAN